MTTQNTPGHRRIRKLLVVANRGEIAKRVIRSARTLDITAVAVHSDPDTDELDAAADRPRRERRIAIHDRRIPQVYHLEARSLPGEDARRLRRAQRHYIEEWVAVLTHSGPASPTVKRGCWCTRRSARSSRSCSTTPGYRRTD